LLFRYFRVKVILRQKLRYNCVTFIHDESLSLKKTKNDGTLYEMRIQPIPTSSHTPTVQLFVHHTIPKHDLSVDKAKATNSNQHEEEGCWYVPIPPHPARYPVLILRQKYWRKKTIAGVKKNGSSCLSVKARCRSATSFRCRLHTTETLVEAASPQASWFGCFS
jgi:hypothetical protein